MAEPKRAEPVTPSDAVETSANVLLEEARFHKRQSKWHRLEAQRRLAVLRRMKPMLDAYGIALHIEGIDGGQSHNDNDTEAAI